VQTREQLNFFLKATIMKTNKKNAGNWLTKDNYACVPLIALQDARMGPRQLKVLCFLASKARPGTNGKVWPSLAHIAELCGFLTTDKKTKVVSPDEALVSKLISNSDYIKTDKDGNVLKSKKGEPLQKGTGMGLVELGYVVKLGQRGNNQTQLYQLVIPTVGNSDLNVATDRRMPNEEYNAKRAGLRKAYDAAEAEAALAMAAEYEVGLEETPDMNDLSNCTDVEPVVTPSSSNTSEIVDATVAAEPVGLAVPPSEVLARSKKVYRYNGDEYHFGDVFEARHIDNCWGDLPRPAVEFFGFVWEDLTQ
jgi:hypothetical protein